MNLYVIIKLKTYLQIRELNIALDNVLKNK
jgi:hypothetical protein